MNRLEKDVIVIIGGDVVFEEADLPLNKMLPHVRYERCRFYPRGGAVVHDPVFAFSDEDSMLAGDKRPYVSGSEFFIIGRREAEVVRE